MKKITALLLAAALLCMGMAYAEADIPVYIDGVRLEFDVTPKLMNDRVMVPMRFIFEKLGASVDFEAESQTIVASKPNADGTKTTIILQIGNPRAFAGTGAILLDSPPVLVDDRTLVPVRFVSESLGCEVDWNDAEQAVYITTKK